MDRIRRASINRAHVPFKKCNLTLAYIIVFADVHTFVRTHALHPSSARTPAWCPHTSSIRHSHTVLRAHANLCKTRANRPAIDRPLLVPSYPVKRVVLKRAQCSLVIAHSVPRAFASRTFRARTPPPPGRVCPPLGHLPRPPHACKSFISHARNLSRMNAAAWVVYITPPKGACGELRIFTCLFLIPAAHGLCSFESLIDFLCLLLIV